MKKDPTSLHPAAKAALLLCCFTLVFATFLKAQTAFSSHPSFQTGEKQEQQAQTNLKKILDAAYDRHKLKFLYDETTVASLYVPASWQELPASRLMTELQAFLKQRKLQLTKMGQHQYVITQLEATPAPKEQRKEAPRPPLQVTGIVKDKSGAGQRGVNITEKGTNNGTTTDTNGVFTLTVAGEGSIIQVSAVGYLTIERKVQKGVQLVIELEYKTDDLSEVAIIGFGLSNKKATLSGAISTVSAEELSHSKATTASAALVGKASGINFRQTTGKPGSEPTLQIRNYGTPLIIIDGVQKDFSSFSQLDFNDIESINILKDATASIYGMQAANGVVVINTKKGKRNQKPVITFQSYYGVQKPGGYNKPADASTYLKTIVQDETYNNVPDNARTVTKAEYEKWVNGSDADHQSFDWYKYIWLTRPQAYANINVAGGSDNVDYYLSAGHLEQKGMLRNFNGFNRTNLQANLNVNISRKFKVGMNMTGRFEHNDNPGLPGDDYDFALNAAFRNLPTKRPFANNDPRYPAISTIDPQYSYGWINYSTSGKFQVESRIIQVNGTAEYEITRGLKARALVSYWFKNYKTDLQEKAPILYNYNSGTDKYNIAYQGTARYMERNMQNNEEITTNVQLDYERSFERHHVHAVTGVETKQGSYPRLYLLGSPEADGIMALNIRSVTALTDDISYTQKRLGVIGRLNYDYDNKYIVELSGRYDGSYFYKPGKRFGFFPSGSLAYRVSQEDFWKDNDFLRSTINDLKLRGSYGVLGQELGTALSYITGYNFNQGSSILDGRDIVSSRVTGLATDNITWGRVYVLNLGIDAGFLQNRLTAGFDWFDRHQTGQLASRYDVFLPNEIGFTLPAENLNSDHTRGIEFSLNWRDKVHDFTYSAGGNFTFSRWITGDRYKPHWASSYDQYRDLGNTSGRYRDGTFQLVAIGQFKNWEDIAKYPIDQDHYGNTTIRPGDYIYQDTNGDGFINDLDMKNVTYRVNSGTPWINFGFNFAAGWKGIDVRTDFAGGSCFTYEQQSYMRYFDGNANVSQYLADHSTWYNDIWDKNSGFNIGKYPLLTKGVNNWMNTHWPNSFWQTNVTYVKLRNLELGYTFPASLVSKARITNLRVYFAAQNILTISNMPGGLDPEITSNAGTSYPNPRILTMGFSLKF